MSRRHQVRLRPSGRSFEVRSGETILAAAMRHAVWLPSRCRNGSCGQCVGRRISGEFSHVVRPAVALEPDQICLCIAIAVSDLEIEAEDLPEPQRRLRRLPAKVIAVVEGMSNLMTLRLPPIAQTVLSAGCRMDIRAPASHAGSLTILSGVSEGTVLARWDAGDNTGVGWKPTFQAGDTLQVELLV